MLTGLCYLLFFLYVGATREGESRAKVIGMPYGS